MYMQHCTIRRTLGFSLPSFLMWSYLTEKSGTLGGLMAVTTSSVDSPFHTSQVLIVWHTLLESFYTPIHKKARGTDPFDTRLHLLLVFARKMSNHLENFWDVILSCYISEIRPPLSLTSSVLSCSFRMSRLPLHTQRWCRWKVVSQGVVGRILRSESYHHPLFASSWLLRGSSKRDENDDERRTANGWLAKSNFCNESLISIQTVVLMLFLNAAAPAIRAASIGG